MFNRAAFVAIATAWLCAFDVMAAPCAGFTDVDDSNPFCANVVWIKNRNVTLGCAANLYCPDAPVNRLSMAAFLNRLGDAVLPPRVLWVAEAGGTFDSIQAAIDYAVSQGASEFSPWLVKVAPGTYFEKVTLRDGVDVEGSGTARTLITSNATLGTVASGAKAELRRIGVENTAVNPYPLAASAAVWHIGGPTRLVDVTLRGLSGYAIALYVASGELLVENSRIDAQGGAYADGAVQDTGRVTLRNVDVSAITTPGIAGNGIVMNNGELTITQSRINVPVLNDTSTGIRVIAGQLLLENSSITTQSATPSPATPATALVNGGTVMIRNSTLSAMGQTATAISNSGGAGIHGSALVAFGSVTSNAFVHTGTVARIAHTQLVGNTSGVTACFNTYDAAFAAVACP